MIPNPSSGIANIVISPNLSNDKSINLKLFDLAGRMVLSVLEFNSDSNRIDLTSLLSGTYIYQIEINHEFHTGKINIIR